MIQIRAAVGIVVNVRNTANDPWGCPKRPGHLDPGIGVAKGNRERRGSNAESSPYGRGSGPVR